MRARTTLVAVSLVVGGLVTSASPAAADFHFMKIREVLVRTTGDSNQEFVELQMYSAGQTNLSPGHSLIFYNSAGAPSSTYPIPNDVGNGTNQASVLFATSTTATGGVEPDFTIDPGMLSDTGGSVCFDTIDCMSYGTVTGAPPNTGTPAGVPVAGQSLTRRIDPGCATLLENGDDTDNSSNDFVSTAPSPRNNSTPPTETACGGGGGQQTGDPAVRVLNLKTKTPGNKAVISGRIEPPDPGGKVKLTLFAKSSPFRKVGKKSDTLDGDSRFKKRFKVPSDSARCKLTVKYRGNVEAIKKFKC